MSRLRSALTKAICALPAALSQSRMTSVLDEAGVPGRSEPPISKAKDAAARAALVQDGDVTAVSARLIARLRQDGSAFAREVFDLEEELWKENANVVAIPRRCRHELAQRLSEAEIPLHLDGGGLLASLEALHLIPPDDGLAMLGLTTSTRAQIERHAIRNDDFGWSELFRVLGADTLSDRRFGLLLEHLVGPRVRPDLKEQEALVGAANPVLADCGLEMRPSGDDGGYPTYAVVPRGQPTRPVKNLIFASARKPDIILRDATTNDIEVVNGASEVLVYDRPIGKEGLRWCDLQAWWAETRHISDPAQAKSTLYKRLREILPGTSPPQARLFQGYHELLGPSVPRMPALLPEVWLHYDPLTVRQRGFAVLLRQRMDFLLLLPGDVRVVVEVDGALHYGDDDGRANPNRYARMVAADRDLRLDGYEVYRFGAGELQDERWRELVADFFRRLFRRHGLLE